MVNLRTTTGALSLPLGALFVVLSLASLGLLGLMQQWRNLTALQLRLDRCTAQTAIALKSNLRSVEATNQIIAKTRLLLAAALIPTPGAVPALRQALIASAAYQEWLRGEWEIRRLGWLTRTGCPELLDRSSPFPKFPWFRDPPDPIGPRPLRWIKGMDHQFRLQLSRKSRSAAAEVSDQGDQQHAPAKWKAVWTRPRPEAEINQRASSH